jgi:hypothetical protein
MVKKINRAQEPGKLRERFARYALGLPAAAPSLPVAMTLRDAAPAILETHVAAVLSHAASLDDARDALGHHELRKAMKRLRYSLEFFAPCLDKPVKPHLKTLTKLQDLLGEMNDRDVLRQNIEHAFPIGNVKWQRQKIEVDASSVALDSLRRTASADEHLPPDIAEFLRYGDGPRAASSHAGAHSCGTSNKRATGPLLCSKVCPDASDSTNKDAREPATAL